METKIKRLTIVFALIVANVFLSFSQTKPMNQMWGDALSIPYFPNTSMGWDDSPRFPHKGKEHVDHYHKSPESFTAFLEKAKGYCDKHPQKPKLITVFSWNEWVEGGYLLPDMKYGFGHLEAVKNVFGKETKEK